MIDNLIIPCSFCGRTQSEQLKIIIKDVNTAICNECVINAIKLFIKSGVEMKIDIEINSEDV